jgi:DNA-binding NarL/FixJ family response regulator
MKNKINTIIVDDNPVFLAGLNSLLNRDSRFIVIEKLSSGKALLESKNLENADLILLDIEMPEMNGIEAAKRVNFKEPRIKLVAITMYQDKVYLEQLVMVGFRGFVNKSEVTTNLFGVIDQVLKNKLAYPSNIKLSNQNNN